MASAGSEVRPDPGPTLRPPQNVFGIIALYVGDPEAGATALQPVKDLGPAVDHIGPMTYTRSRPHWTRSRRTAP